MLRWGKEHLIGIILGIVVYEFYTRRKAGNPGGGGQ